MIWLLGGAIVLSPIVRFIDFRLFYESAPIWLTKGFHANVDTLAIGCLLAFKHKTLHESAMYRRLIGSKWMYALPVVIVLLNSQIDYPGLRLGILFSINNILIALMIDWAVTNSENAFGRVLNSRPFVFIGMMSYSIYLWQQPFLNPDPSSGYFAFPYSLIGFLFFCCLSYFVVEKYSLMLRKRSEARIFIGASVKV
jgi:peptidoglycan/LPS O-acetylase OafA/YrhL